MKRRVPGIPGAGCIAVSLTREFLAGFELRFAGMAMRLAFDLGLHVDMTPYVEKGIVTADECRMRRMIYWGVYLNEQSVFSLFFSKCRTNLTCEKILGLLLGSLCPQSGDRCDCSEAMFRWPSSTDPMETTWLLENKCAEHLQSIGHYFPPVCIAI